MSREDAAVCHGMMGGIPAYIEKSDPVAPLKDNIKRLFLTPTGYLFEEPSNLLLQECRNPEQYDATVQAIAQGRSKISEIASSTGIPASNVKTMTRALRCLRSANGAMSPWAKTCCKSPCTEANSLDGSEKAMHSSQNVALRRDVGMPRRVGETSS